MRLREVVLVMGRDSLGEEFMVMVEGEVAGIEVMGEDNVRGIEWVGVIGEDEMGVLGEEMVGEGVGGGCWRGMGCCTFQNDTLRLESGHFQMSG